MPGIRTLLAPFIRLAAVVGICTAAGALHAQQPTYPSRAITIVVPAAAGGGIDRTARLMADRLRGKWGQPVVIENRGGAGGMIGTAHVANAAPDGYTLLLAGVGHIAIDRGEKLGYDPEGWVPISLVTTAPNVLVVNPNVPARSIQEFIELARAKGGGVTYASQGIGTTMHLSMEWLKSLARVEMVHVPYSGGGPALTDVLSGQVDAMFTESGGVLPNINAGKLRPLAVGSETRNALLPNLPTMNETYPGFISTTWQALVAPKGTPRDVVRVLADAIAEAVAVPEIAEALRGASLTPVGGSPDDLAAFIRDERRRWRDVIANAKIKFQP